MKRQHQDIRDKKLIAAKLVCPYPECPSRSTEATDFVIHSQVLDKVRYCCKICGRTFYASSGRFAADKKSPTQSEKYAFWLSKNGYSMQEIAFILGISKRTVYRWFERINGDESQSKGSGKDT